MRAAWCVVVGLLLALVVGASPALAHSSLVRSDPADGSTVEVGRTQLTLWFDEPVLVAASTFRLHTADGGTVRVAVSTTSSTSAFIELTTSPLPRGALVLEWETASAVDGHHGTGSLRFGAGAPAPPAAATAGQAPRPVDLVLRWIRLSLLMAAVGVLLAPRLLRRAGDVAPEAVDRALRLGPVVALAALLSTLFTPLLAPRSADTLPAVTHTWWGAWWGVQVVALAVATVALALRVRSRRPALVATAALVVAACADAASGHTADLPRESVPAVVAAACHLLAAGAWAGTLGVLALCLAPTMWRRPTTRRALLATVFRAFGPVAAAAVLVLVATGLYLAGRELPSPAALTHGWYGVALAGKTLALAVALALAVGTSLAAHPRLARGLASRLGVALPVPAAVAIPRRVLAELGVLGSAVLLAAVMTSVPAARATPDTTAGDPATAMADGLFLSFESMPADPGRRHLVVRVNAVTRPQPGPVTGVDVMTTDADGRATTTTLGRVERGLFETSAPAPSATSYRVWVSVHRAGAPDAVAGLRWHADPAPPRSTFETVSTTVAFGLLLVGAGIALWVVRTRRRESPDQPPPPAGATPLVSVGAQDGARDA